MNLRPILEAVLDEYALPWNGIHGVGHWARVLENGLRLAEQTGANLDVVSLFALFHDSKRVNEGHDPDHGQRAQNSLRNIKARCLIFPKRILTDCEKHARATLTS